MNVNNLSSVERELLVKKKNGELPACYESCEELRKALKKSTETMNRMVLSNGQLRILCGELAEALVEFSENDQYTNAAGNLVEFGRLAAAGEET